MSPGWEGAAHAPERSMAEAVTSADASAPPPSGREHLTDAERAGLAERGPRTPRGIGVVAHACHRGRCRCPEPRWRIPCPGRCRCGANPGPPPPPFVSVACGGMPDPAAELLGTLTVVNHGKCIFTAAECACGCHKAEHQDDLTRKELE